MRFISKKEQQLRSHRYWKARRKTENEHYRKCAGVPKKLIRHERHNISLRDFLNSVKRPHVPDPEPYLEAQLPALAVHRDDECTASGLNLRDLPILGPNEELPF